MNDIKALEIKVLSHEVASKNVERLLEIEKDYTHSWAKENFLLDLPEKWDLSSYAEINGEIVGFIVASKKPDSFYIHRFMVHQKYRGKGVGKILHSNFEKLCLHKNQKGSICLRVFTDNLPAIKLYGKLGYEIISREKNPDEVYLMKKKLNLG